MNLNLLATVAFVAAISAFAPVHVTAAHADALLPPCCSSAPVDLDPEHSSEAFYQEIAAKNKPITAFQCLSVGNDTTATIVTSDDLFNRKVRSLNDCNAAKKAHPIGS